MQNGPHGRLCSKMHMNGVKSKLEKKQKLQCEKKCFHFLFHIASLFSSVFVNTK